MNDDEKRRKRLIEYTKKNCVFVDVDLETLAEMIKWCKTNIGEERFGHPLYEAEVYGYIDYFEGDWAESHHKDTTYCFWFENQKHKVEFSLRWL